MFIFKTQNIVEIVILRGLVWDSELLIGYHKKVYSYLLYRSSLRTQISHSQTFRVRKGFNSHNLHQKYKGYVKRLSTLRNLR